MNRRNVLIVLLIFVIVIALRSFGGEPDPEAAGETQTPSEILEAAVGGVLKGNNNRKVPHLKNLNLTGGEQEPWRVEVEMNASHNLSVGFIRTSIEIDMFQVYKALYNSGQPIETAVIMAYYPLQDKYGNSKDVVVYESALIGTEAAKINWENITHQSIRKLWAAKIHPALQD